MFVSEVEFMLHKKQLNRVIKIQELKLKLLEVERSIKTSFTEESNQLFFNYKGYQYNLFPGDFLIFEYNEFIDGFQFICVEREKDSLKKIQKM